MEVLVEVSSIAFGPLTVAFREELIVVSFDRRGVSSPTREPSLYKRGVYADHLTIPFVARTHGPKAGGYWIHLTYPDKKRIDVATIRPEHLVEVFGGLDDRVNSALRKFIASNIRVVDSSWLTARGYQLIFMFEDEFPELLKQYFRQRRRGLYRVSMSRLNQLGEEMYVMDPSVLDEDGFDEIAPSYIQAVCLERKEEKLTLGRRPSREGQRCTWYAYPSYSIIHSIGPVIEDLYRSWGPRVLESVRTVLIELGVPDEFVDYKKIDASLEDLKHGRIDLRLPKSDADWEAE